MFRADIERRMSKAEERISWLDEHGTRGVNALTQQVVEMGKDMGKLEGTMAEIKKTVDKQASSRWTTVITLSIAMLPLYGLVIALLAKA